jgi:hypothetical protein
MTHTRTALVSLVILTQVFVGCAARHRSGSTAVDLNRFAWLLGTWESRGQRGATLEEWSQGDNGTLRGVAYRVVDGDTTINETVRLLQEASEVFYAADVSGDQPEVRFRLVDFGSRGAQFANPGHDFPTSIIYRPVGADSLYARIEGVVDGQKRALEFRYRRVAGANDRTAKR